MATLQSFSGFLHVVAGTAHHRRDQAYRALLGSDARKGIDIREVSYLLDRAWVAWDYHFSALENLHTGK